MIGPADIGGVHIKYLHHCRRQLWLYGRGFRPEHLSDPVQLGDAVNDTSYTRTSPVDLGAARLDFIDGQKWVHEVKSSAGPTKADEAQAMHYCFRLKEIGIDARGGILHYPKTRRTRRLSYTQTEEARARADITEALSILQAGQSPPRLGRADCRGCSYLDYCWTGLCLLPRAPTGSRPPAGSAGKTSPWSSNASPATRSTSLSPTCATSLPAPLPT